MSMQPHCNVVRIMSERLSRDNRLFTSQPSSKTADRGRSQKRRQPGTVSSSTRTDTNGRLTSISIVSQAQFRIRIYISQLKISYLPVPTVYTAAVGTTSMKRSFLRITANGSNTHPCCRHDTKREQTVACRMRCCREGPESPQQIKTEI